MTTKQGLSHCFLILCMDGLLCFLECFLCSDEEEEEDE
jgi:hypothetical protein